MGVRFEVMAVVKAQRLIVVRYYPEALLAIDPEGFMENRIFEPVVDALEEDRAFLARVKKGFTGEVPQVVVQRPVDLDDAEAVLSYLAAFGEKAYGGMKMEVVRAPSGDPVVDATGRCSGYVVPPPHPLAGKKGG